MRHLSLILAFSAGAAFLYSACLFPEISYLSEDEGTGGVGGMTTTTAGGMGGVGGDPTTTTGGTGGMPEQCDEVADLGRTGLCESGQKCTVTNPASGTVGCAIAGPKADWDTCGSDGDCGDGSFCDLQRSVCKPFCQNINDCAATSGECVAATQLAGTDIPNGVKTCISMCNPVNATPCNTSATTCAFIGNNQFDCAQSQGVTIGNGCNTQADCAAGLACIDSFGKACEQYCSPIGSGHANCVFNCAAFDTPVVTWMGMDIGTCL